MRAGRNPKGPLLYPPQVEQLSASIAATRQKWRALGTPVRQADVDQAVTSHMQAVDRGLGDLKRKLETQKKKEEEERLRKIQEEMERERKRKEAEEQKRREEEEERRKKAEMEERRRKEEEERQKQEERDRAAAAELQRKLKAEAEAEAERARVAEQERLDRELAMRLAAEDGSAVEEDVSLPRAASVLAQRAANASKKHDLSKWKYADLRDTINTSCGELANRDR